MYLQINTSFPCYNWIQKKTKKMIKKQEMKCNTNEYRKATQNKNKKNVRLLSK